MFGILEKSVRIIATLKIDKPTTQDEQKMAKPAI
jgi:hypothetical protein